MQNIITSDVPIWDITIKGEHDVKNIKNIFNRLYPTWDDVELEIKVFESGLSNTVVHIEATEVTLTNNCYDGECNSNSLKVAVLIRIYGRLSKVLLDNWIEIQHMYVLNKLGNRQKLLGIFSNGLVYSFIPGSTIEVESFSNPQCKLLIINEMARLHSLPVIKVIGHLFSAKLTSNLSAYSKWISKHSNVTVFDQLRKWIEQIPQKLDSVEQTDKLNKEYPPGSVILKETLFVEQLLTKPHSPIVLCHNDLLADNIIITPDKSSVHFIDLEYSGFNHAAYDIANHFCEYTGINVSNFADYPSDNYQRQWITQYIRACDFYHNSFQSINSKQNWRSSQYDYYSVKYDFKSDKDVPSDVVEQWLKEVNYFAMVSNLFWSVWAVIRASNTQKSFDYLKYGITRMSQYYEMKSKMKCENGQSL